MSRTNQIKKNATRMIKERARKEQEFTEGCLTAACIFRYYFQKKHNRKPTLHDCPKTCYYRPDSVFRLDVESSPGRTFPNMHPEGSPW